MFAVYDGHHGRHVAQYLRRHLFEKVTEEPEFEEGDYEDVLRKAYLKLNKEILRKEKLKRGVRRDGAVAVTALLIGDARVVVANAGDARAILCLDDGRFKQLTEVHRAENPLEARRVKARGGRVVCSEETGVCRVDGQLMPTRAFGDRDLAPHITAEPDLRLVDLHEGRPCVLVLASDGLWNVMGDEEVADELMREVASKTELEMVAQNLIRASVRLGSKDDISVILCRVKRRGRRVKQEEEARGEGEVIEPPMQAGAGA